MPFKQYWKKKKSWISLIVNFGPQFVFQATKLIFFIWNQALTQHQDFHLQGPVWKWLRLLFKVFFYSEKHQNNIFYILKIIFDISTSKWFKNIKNILIWSKEKNIKNSNFFISVFETQKQIEH
jgi:hypothetical protein